MTRPSPLDDPDYAAFAWGRFRRIMGWMALIALVTALLSIAALWWSLGEMRVHMAIATFLGVFFTVLLGTALMGLTFLSSGTGHDERVEDPLKREMDSD